MTSRAKISAQYIAWCFHETDRLFPHQCREIEWRRAGVDMDGLGHRCLLAQIERGSEIAMQADSPNRNLPHFPQSAPLHSICLASNRSATHQNISGPAVLSILTDYPPNQQKNPIVFYSILVFLYTLSLLYTPLKLGHIWLKLGPLFSMPLSVAIRYAK
ncbi:hypothetical protein C8R45DRAFT_1081252 [Mycena sanguinolenta]|nr:hypothetical protein C8R45DRAFT_1081252 [Mycena sanguinolenta]